MSFPQIPNITPSINISIEDVTNLLLASIAFEELGLAHIINAEAEKIQYMLGTLPGQSAVPPANFGSLISVNRSVVSILRNIIKQQMLLQFKLEDVLEISTCTATTQTMTSTTTTTETTTSATATTTTTTSEVRCTLSVGYYKNHPEVVFALITAAGGSVLLGDGGGASYTVTTANAIEVLSFNTPVPPAPSMPPLAEQYQNLYAQLLAAKLNVQGGASCEFAIIEIAAADAFLSASAPEIGMDGAAEIADNLALYNEGNAPECPGHCQ